MTADSHGGFTLLQRFPGGAITTYLSSAVIVNRSRPAQSSPRPAALLPSVAREIEQVAYLKALGGLLEIARRLDPPVLRWSR